MQKKAEELVQQVAIWQGTRRGVGNEVGMGIVPDSETKMGII